jgi:hypothetical protein
VVAIASEDAKRREQVSWSADRLRLLSGSPSKQPYRIAMALTT